MSLSRRTLAGKTKADHALDLRRQLDLCTAGVNVGDKSGCSQASLGKVPENKTPVGATEADSEVTHIIIPFYSTLNQTPALNQKAAKWKMEADITFKLYSVL